MNFTPEQKQYILDKADNLVRSTVLRVTWLLVAYMIVYYSNLPDDWNLIALPLYWAGFAWMAMTQVARMKRIFGFEQKKKKESKWTQLVVWLAVLKDNKKTRERKQSEKLD